MLTEVTSQRKRPQKTFLPVSQSWLARPKAQTMSSVVHPSQPTKPFHLVAMMVTSRFVTLST